ncbi:MAG: preprotein translocase subunit SecE [Defluviitaleaceae bacterium]|nr:preprotein translocase subunit SecE [Defluviitaleaceae bacterium]
MSEKKAKTKPEKEKRSLSDRFKDYRVEFKRITWPNRKEIIKSSVTVVITCVIFGIAIFIMDFIFNRGMEVFVNLVS